MTDEVKLTEEEWHKKTAVDLFNHTWDLLDKIGRTVAENDDMLHSAHASRYHWGKIGGPINFQGGEWQISRVNSTLNRAEAAMYHAQRALQICKENGIGDFNLAFAYEAVARAYAVGGDIKGRDEYFALANEAGRLIAKDDDRNYFFSEMKTIPGYEDDLLGSFQPVQAIP